MAASVIFYLLLFLGVLKSEANTCADNFRDMKGNSINLEEYCKDKYCVTKCCKENELFLVNDPNGSCVPMSNLARRLNSNFTVYKYFDGKIEKAVKNSHDLTFVRNLKLEERRCAKVKHVEMNHFHMFENTSLIIEDTSSGKIINHIDRKEYCMDYVLDDTNGGTLKPAFNIVPKIECNNKFMHIDNNVPVNLTQECKDTHCIAKCCKQKSRVFFVPYEGNIRCASISQIEKLTNQSIKIDYSAINIYKSNIERRMQKANISLKQFKIIRNQKMSMGSCVSQIELNKNKFHILENSSLVLDLPNYYKRFIRYWKMEDFCFEHLIMQTETGIQEPILLYRYVEPEKTDTGHTQSNIEIYKAVALLISCFFLILVLFVYGVIHELRNLVGMVLMGYVGTLAVTFLFKAIEFLGVRGEVLDTAQCKSMSVFLYFTTLSSFFWMNVMSLDIWWTFRAIFKSRQIHRRGELVKFGWYALYSWGVPLMVTIAVAAIDYIDLTHLPHIYKPHFEHCFYMKEEVMEMRHYLYMPILALLIVDFIFFVMTTFNIWRIRKSMAKFANDASKYNNNQNRFGLYVKLSLVMGISWIFETLDLPSWLQYPAMAYNGLTGVAIFIIFVFKRKILFKLCKRFSVENEFIDNLQRKYSKYSTATTTQSQEK